MGLESILGGFAKGFGQAKMLKMRKERDSEFVALQKQKYQLDIQNAKTAALDKKRKADFEQLLYQSPKFQKMFGINPGAGESAKEPYTKTSSSAEPPKMGESFSGELAKMQMDPMMAALMKEVTGLDMLGAGRLEAQQQTLDLNKKRFERGATETKFQNVPTGAGGSQLLEFPKFGGSSGQARLMGQTPAPTDFEERKKGGKTQRRIINKATKEPVGKWRDVSGKKGLAGEAAGKLEMVQSGLSDLKLAKDILMPGGNVNKKRIFEMSMPGGGLPKSEGREAKAYLLNAMEGKIRIESGAAVPDQEMARLALRFMPSLLDSDKLVKAKLNRLGSYLGGVIEKLDPNKNYGTGTELITGENGEQFAWIPKGGGKTKMPDPLGIR